MAFQQLGFACTPVLSISRNVANRLVLCRRAFSPVVDVQQVVQNDRQLGALGGFHTEMPMTGGTVRGRPLVVVHQEHVDFARIANLPEQRRRVLESRVDVDQRIGRCAAIGFAFLLRRGCVHTYGKHDCRDGGSGTFHKTSFNCELWYVLPSDATRCSAQREPHRHRRFTTVGPGVVRDQP